MMIIGVQMIVLSLSLRSRLCLQDGGFSLTFVNGDASISYSGYFLIKSPSSSSSSSNPSTLLNTKIN
jgi:hypothetical protein